MINFIIGVGTKSNGVIYGGSNFRKDKEIEGTAYESNSKMFM